MFNINFIIINYDNNQEITLNDFNWYEGFNRMGMDRALEVIQERTGLTKDRINFFYDFSYFKYVVRK